MSPPNSLQPPTEPHIPTACLAVAWLASSQTAPLTNLLLQGPCKKKWGKKGEEILKKALTDHPPEGFGKKGGGLQQGTRTLHQHLHHAGKHACKKALGHSPAFIHLSLHPPLIVLVPGAPLKKMHGEKLETSGSVPSRWQCPQKGKGVLGL